MRQSPLTELRDCPRCAYRTPMETRSRQVFLDAPTTLVPTRTAGAGPHPSACTCAPTTPPHFHAACPRCGVEYAVVEAITAPDRAG